MSDASPPTETPEAPRPEPTAVPAPVRPASDGKSPPIAPAFLAAGVMLAIMAAWIRAGFDPPPHAAYLLVVAIAAACIGYGAMKALLKVSGRTSVGFAAAVSILMLGVAGWLASAYGLDALGQTLGLAMFALLGFGAAVGWAGGSVRDRLPSSPLTQIVLFLLGFVVLAAAIYLRAVRQIGNTYWPEQIGLFLAGFILLFGAVWLYATVNRTPEFLTTFFVVLGSALGSILTLYALCRGVLNWSTHTAEPWRGWIVAYALAAGLGLIYSSLILASDRAQQSSVARQSIYGFATIFCGILAFAILVVFNVFVFFGVGPYTLEWSKTRGLTSLSTASKNLLAGLDKKVEVYVLMSPQSFLYQKMKTMLDNAAALAPTKFEVISINPDSALDAKKFDALANRFKEIVSAGGREDQEQSRGILLVYGPMPNDLNTPVPHAVIPVRRLFDEQMKTFTFKGEAEVMKELDFLAHGRQKRKIYMLQGDNELDLNSKEALQFTTPTVNITRLGAASLAEALVKDNYEVSGLSFRPASPDDKTTNIVHAAERDGKKAEVPSDCDTLMILAPSAPLPAVALDAIERYLDRDGRLFVTIGLPGESDYSKLKETGLEGLLKKYGIDVTSEFVMHFPSNRLPDPTESIATASDKNDSLLAKQFAGRVFRLGTPRIIKPGTSAKHKAEPLLVCDPRFDIWAEDSLLIFTEDANRYLAEKFGGRPKQAVLSPRALPVAVTLTTDGKPRGVVIGEADFLSNAAFRTDRQRNYDLAASALSWMGQRGFVGPRPIESSNYTLSREADFASMTVGTAWTLVALLIVIGGCIWIVRRR